MWSDCYMYELVPAVIFVICTTVARWLPLTTASFVCMRIWVCEKNTNYQQIACYRIHGLQCPNVGLIVNMYVLVPAEIGTVGASR